ncbi:MAG: hypothetical protein GY711_13510 [bacterium]|nr:hypothetical protein [bacterium]
MNRSALTTVGVVVGASGLVWLERATRLSNPSDPIFPAPVLAAEKAGPHRALERPLAVLLAPSTASVERRNPATRARIEDTAVAAFESATGEGVPETPIAAPQEPLPVTMAQAAPQDAPDRNGSTPLARQGAVEAPATPPDAPEAGRPSPPWTQGERGSRASIVAGILTGLAVLLAALGVARARRSVRRRTRARAAVDSAIAEALALRGDAGAHTGLEAALAAAQRAAQRAASLARTERMDASMVQRSDELVESLAAEVAAAREHLARRDADRELGARLEWIRDSPVQRFRAGGIGDAYAAAFAAHGLDLDELDPNRIRSSPLREQLIDALDHWGRLATGEARRLRALQLAQAADDCEERGRVRSAVMANDLDELRALSQPAAIRAAPQERLSALGEALAALGEGKAAVRIWRMLVRKHPSDFRAHFLLGCHGEQEHAQLAITLRPDSVAAWTSLGYVRRSCGNVAGAVLAFERVVELAPDASLGYANLCEVLHEAALDAEAIEVARRWTARFSDDPRAHLSLARSLKRTGDGAAARDALEWAEGVCRRALDARPQDAELLRQLTSIRDERAGRTQAETPRGARERPERILPALSVQGDQ